MSDGRYKVQRMDSRVLGRFDGCCETVGRLVGLG